LRKVLQNPTTFEKNRGWGFVTLFPKVGFVTLFPKVGFVTLFPKVGGFVTLFSKVVQKIEMLFRFE